MGAGDVTVDIVEQPLTSARVDTAVTAVITTAGADATLAITSIRNGEAILIVAVDIA